MNKNKESQLNETIRGWKKLAGIEFVVILVLLASLCIQTNHKLIIIEPINLCKPPIVQAVTNTVFKTIYKTNSVAAPSHWYDCFQYRPQPLPPAKKVYPVLIKK